MSTAAGRYDAPVLRQRRAAARGAAARPSGYGGACRPAAVRPAVAGLGLVSRTMARGTLGRRPAADEGARRQRRAERRIRVEPDGADRRSLRYGLAGPRLPDRREIRNTVCDRHPPRYADGADTAEISPGTAHLRKHGC